MQHYEIKVCHDGDHHHIYRSSAHLVVQWLTFNHYLHPSMAEDIQAQIADSDLGATLRYVGYCDTDITITVVPPQLTLL